LEVILNQLIQKILEILRDPHLAEWLQRHKFVANILAFLFTVLLVANFFIAINESFPIFELPTLLPSNISTKK
jgi:hypothetical protein